MTKENLVPKLIKLTNQDLVRWERPILNIHSTNFNGWHFYTEMLQDDRPRLEISDPQGKKTAIQSYGCGIEELNAAIDNQYKRLGLYDYSQEHQEMLKKLDRQKTEEQAQQAHDFAELSKKFCEPSE